jgi:hypothetical protein
LIWVNVAVLQWTERCPSEHVAPGRAMPAQRLKFVVTGLFLSAVLAFVSAPAEAHGGHRDGHPTVIQTGGFRPDPSPPVVVEQSSFRQHTLPRTVSSLCDGSSSCPSLSSPQAPGMDAWITQISARPCLCGQAGGCLCCGTGGACGGMSCCTVALPVGSPGLPYAEGPIMAIFASASLQGATVEALLRPPRLMA